MPRLTIPPELAANRDRALALVDVSRETLDRLDQLVEVLLLWREKANLIASSTIPQIWTRHIADSLQLIEVAASQTPAEPLTWIDLGSGAGFPGLPIACALAGRPGAHVMLVETNTRKAAFLREAVRVTGAPVSVFHERIERFTGRPDAQADVVTARALSPLKLLLDQSFSLLKTGALGVFPKGQDVAAELTEAAKYWNINHILVPSRTDAKGRIVVVNKVSRRARSVQS